MFHVTLVHSIYSMAWKINFRFEFESQWLRWIVLTGMMNFDIAFLELSWALRKAWLQKLQLIFSSNNLFSRQYSHVYSNILLQLPLWLLLLLFSSYVVSCLLPFDSVHLFSAMLYPTIDFKALVSRLLKTAAHHILLQCWTHFLQTIDFLCEAPESYIKGVFFPTEEHQPLLFLYYLNPSGSLLCNVFI